MLKMPPGPPGILSQSRRATTEHAFVPRSMEQTLGQAAACPRRRAPFYGASRSASDATSLVYTTKLVLRGRRTPPVGSVGSCVASYTLFLAWVLVKVFVSVTENRYVALVCCNRKRSTGGGNGTVEGWLIASVVGS